MVVSWALDASMAATLPSLLPWLELVRLQWLVLLVVSVLFSRVLVSPLLEHKLLPSAVAVACSEGELAQEPLPQLLPEVSTPEVSSEEVSMRIKEQSST